MSNRVEIRIDAVDNISSTIRGIRGQISGVTSGFRAVAFPAMQLATVVGGLGATMAGLAKLSAGFKTAVDEQVKAVGAANSLRLSLGVTLPKGSEIVADLQKQISKEAMILPIEAKDATGIFNQVSSGISAVYKNVEQYKEKMVATTTQLALLAKGSGLTSSQAAEGFNKVSVGQSSIKELQQLEFFEKNPNVIKGFIDNMKLLGVAEKDIGKAGAAMRTVAIEKAMTGIVTPEFKATLAKTAAGQLNSLSDSLFDNDNGIFGWARTLSSTIGKDGVKKTRNALDSMADFLGSISKLGESVGGYMAKYGGGFDPMKSIAAMTDRFAKDLKDISDIFKKGGDIWNDLTYAFIKKVADGLGSLSKQIDRINWEQMGKTFGSNIAKILTSDELGIGLEKLLVASINALGKSIAGVLDGIAGQIKNAFVSPLEKKANSALNDATGGVLGNKGDGQKNGIQKFWDWVGGQTKPPLLPQEQLGRSGSPRSSLPKLDKMSNSTNRYDIKAPISITVANGADFDSEAVADKLLSVIDNRFRQRRDMTMV